MLSGRSGGGRDHKVSGPGLEGVQTSFSTRHGQPHVPSYPHPPMYFPYPMAPSMFPSSGGGDARNRIGLSSHPYFSHLPRLGYSSTLPPPPLHPTDGGGGGHYPRPGRPWWTVPPFPPPSHLHHPHHSHPPPNDNDRHLTYQDEHPPPPMQQPELTTTASEFVTTSTVPRTTSRNAYTQQRMSILRKQQQKEQASKSPREQNLSMSNSVLKSTAMGVSQKMKLLSMTEDIVDDNKEGVQILEGAKFA